MLLYYLKSLLIITLAHKSSKLNLGPGYSDDKLAHFLLGQLRGIYEWYLQNQYKSGHGGEQIVTGNFHLHFLYIRLNYATHNGEIHYYF